MKHVYFYGDSNTYGYDPFDFYAGRYPEELVWTNIVQRELSDGWRVTADGMNGREIPRRDGEFSRLESRMKRAEQERGEITLFAVMLGSNDYLCMGSPDASAVAEKMENAVRRSAAMLSPGASDMQKIMMIAPPAMVVPMAGGFGGGMFAGVDTSDGRLSEEYKKAAARVGCRFLDTLPWRIPVTSDGVHFSEDGHALFARKMTEHLRHLSCDLL